MDALKQLQGNQYINIETFRKNGVGVKTPVWFVEDHSSLYIRTIADSGKVKRIRNNPDVKIAACRADGQVLGDWIDAKAYEKTDQPTNKHVDQLLNKKYGLIKKLFGLAAFFQKRQNTVIQVIFET